MKVLFFSSALLIFFAYAGYPICLYFRAKFRPRPVRRAAIFPQVTIVMAVHNEETRLRDKLLNLAALDYPAGRLELIVVSDGSTDHTNEILKEWRNSGEQPLRTAIFLPTLQGKANALNHGVAEAAGSVVCFMDARQAIASDGLKNLVANFADPSVGCASGALVLREHRAGASASGVGTYWRFEKLIRTWESAAGSAVGATGAFYAVRTELLLPLPFGTILDDVYIPLEVARQGKRVVFDPAAIAWDDPSPSSKHEFRRKVRTLAGNYQLLRLAPWLLSRSNPLRIQFVCHKLLRLFVPFALVGMLVSSLGFWGPASELALLFQMIFYALATLTAWPEKAGFLSPLAKISLAFVVLNTAAAVAFFYFVTGKKAAWPR